MISRSRLRVEAAVSSICAILAVVTLAWRAPTDDDWYLNLLWIDRQR